MSNRSVKWDFSNYDYSGIRGCPTCVRAEQAKITGQPYPAWFPEEVSLLCETHYREFKEWDDEQVKLGHRKSWF